MLDFCSDIDKICISLQIQCIFLDTSVCFCYVFSLPSPNIKEVAFGRLHKGARAVFGGPPPFMESFIGAGEAENMAKTYRRIKKYALDLQMYADFVDIAAKI